MLYLSLVAGRISFDVSLILKYTDLYKRGGSAEKPDSNVRILEVMGRSVCSASFYSQEMIVASAKADLAS